ncbi:MAG: hypothetical protein QY332_18800 [Anaerolineales bacterium]|nr:MAG: hypothetical protein QY332_18800 [Anaerolineales bacterium]
MKKVFLVLLVLILAACSPAGQEPETANAETAMRTFFKALANGQYSESVTLYGGEYEVLAGWNPDLSPTDYASLWQRGCEQNGLVCMEVLDIVNAIETEGGFDFTVTFKTKDGGLFEFTGCCGETLPEPITEYEIGVQRDGNGSYQVLSMPPYVP